MKSIKSRMMISLLVISMVAALIGGGTMAWFTAKADAPVNEFTAGTVMLEVGEEVVYGEDMENVNPGDCFLKCIEVTNSGTKAMELALLGVDFEVIIDWEWIFNNWDALCLSETYGTLEELDIASATALEGLFETDDYNLPENPAFIAPCPDSDWVMEYVKDEDNNITGFNFFYAGGPVAPGESANLCVVVVFDGEMMGNIWQAAQFNQLNGVFNAVQASNDAPAEVWGDAWNPDWLAMGAEEALREGTSNAYADYFWVEGDFQFEDCCDVEEENGNDNDGNGNDNDEENDVGV